MGLPAPASKNAARFVVYPVRTGLNNKTALTDLSRGERKQEQGLLRRMGVTSSGLTDERCNFERGYLIPVYVKKMEFILLHEQGLS